MMSDSTEQESSQNEIKTQDAAQSTLALPGRRLRDQRENSHLSREEVANYLRLDAQLIKALEEDDYARLPSRAYICGYLRSYARLLKLPEEEVVRAYNHGEQINAALIPETLSILPKRMAVNIALIKTIVIIIIVALLAAGVYLVAEKFDVFGGSHAQKSSELTVPVAPEAAQQKTKEMAIAPAENLQPPVVNNPVTEQAPPVPANTEVRKSSIEQIPTSKTTIFNIAPTSPNAQTAKTETTPSSQLAHQNKSSAQTLASQPAATPILHLHFLNDSWTEVTDSTGKRLIYQLVEKNTDLNLDGEPPFTILLGNAPAVQVFYKGKEFDHTRDHRGDIAYFKVGAK